MIRIVAPAPAEKAYELAVQAFQDMWLKVTGETLPIITEDDGVSDLVVIGSDAVNDVTAQAMADGLMDILHIRYGTDSYSLLSFEKDGRKLLFLSGGRGRSTLYAVYDYFERVAGCHYFWDGDVIPHHDTLSIEGLNVAEAPRFQYRGLRYFAHRGLWRFQAEHWGREDWEREIDWIVKRRMNFYMLRIGMDDLFQRAFPDEVPYPNPSESGNLMEDDGTSNNTAYNDRTLFWPLEYRGKLSEYVQKYADDRDLMAPEDCGTMTHWYSRTPKEFLEKKQPQLLGQASAGYSNQTGLVWDPRNRRNMDMYMKLTETSVKEYGKPHMFHTIGLAERNIFADRRDNLNMKLFTLHRISQEIYRRYPDSKLFIAGWDFLRWWYPEDVKNLLAEVDPDRTIILDYTNDGDDPDHTFLNWNMIGNIPWIFGIFHAYERQSAIRGPYKRTSERLAIAAADEKCKGLVFWPELSHSDTLVLEYLARNSWQPNQLCIEELAESFCDHRYGAYAGKMNEAWQHALPIIQLFDWGGGCTRTPDDPLYEQYGPHRQHNHCFMMDILGAPDLQKPSAHAVGCWEYALKQHRPVAGELRKTLEALAELPEEALENAFVLRDVVDIARSVIEHRIHHGLLYLGSGILAFQNGADNADELRAQMKKLYAAAQCHAEIIGCHDDYSQQATLEYLNTVCPVNPVYEPTLKRNLVNSYCRQASYEPENYLFLDEARAYYDWVERNLAAGNRGEWAWDLEEKTKELFEVFMAKPLIEMRPPKDNDLRAMLRKAAEIADTIEL